eukprot:jgi/Botrbrau1/4652/Bobra.33_2s0023.1
MSRRPRGWSRSLDEEPRREKSTPYISWSNVGIVAGAVLALVLLLNNNARAAFPTPGVTQPMTSSQSTTSRVVESDPWASQRVEDVYNGSVCPFERIPSSWIREYDVMPYILGEEKRPDCKTCSREGGFYDFCRYQVVGELNCPPGDHIRILEYLLNRADEGAPGYAEMLTMTPCDLFPLFQGRTLWLLGDSQMKEFASTLGCFYREFHDSVPLDGRTGAHAEAWTKLNLSHCWELVEDTRICLLRMILRQVELRFPCRDSGRQIVEEVLPLLPSLGAKPSDIMLLNFGLLSNNLTEYKNQLSLFDEYFQRYKADMPFLIWRETSPQHFKSSTGEYYCPDCDAVEEPYICRRVPNVTLNSRNQLEVSDPARSIVAQGGWRNVAASAVMNRLGIPIMSIWNQSIPIWQFHHHLGKQAMHDCTQSCHPSVYEVWLYLLYDVLKREQGNIKEQESWAT